ncbi:MAG: right-handed parallel beta-helix repeat-containing protein [Symploca sp. SIO2E6]|nr:right-handed parallel beta-helix repeat-containing protein [Symploca sp. SIO2E6]
MNNKISFCLLVVGYWLFNQGFCLAAQQSNKQQTTTNNQQQTTNNQQPTTNNQQPTTNNKQQTTINPVTNVDILVNSNADTIATDEVLTLREAIAIVNGTLPVQELSETERQQVGARKGSTTETAGSRIKFNLPPQQTTIELTKPLSILASPGLLIDGTSQPGYGDSELEVEEITIPIPVVAITPAADTEIWQGLTVVADEVTIRGLSIYGFNSDSIPDALIPPADIFISHPPNPQELSARQSEVDSPHDALLLTEDMLFDSLDMPPPKDVVIENNWLGITPTTEIGNPNPQTTNNQQPTTNNQQQTTNNKQPTTNNQQQTSAFGIYAYNSSNVKITNNAIANHQGSGIITSRQASNLLIEDNLIEGNGFAGMPDAIRLEGDISGAAIISNLIRHNAGSAIFTFKPDGAVEIRDNEITNNGKRLQQAAVYLMGNEHQITDNQISNQPGSGITVAAVPESRRVTITGNQFTNLQGLSIDLVSQQGTTVQAYQVGDGRNPVIDNYQRRRQTANLAIDTPRFLSQEFFFLSPTKVTLLGEALPGSTVEIYRVTDISNGSSWEPITSTSVDEEGNFSITLTEVEAGDQVSAIATHPDYGTSEPAVNSVLRALPTAASPNLENL